jgi:hypothetical protein
MERWRNGWRRVGVFAALAGAVMSAAATAAEPATVAWRDSVQAVFGGRETGLSLRLPPTVPAGARLFWRLTAADRTLTRQSMAVSAAQAKAGLVNLKIELATVRSEVGLAVTAEAWLEAAGREQGMPAQAKVWVLGDNPFPALRLAALTVWDQDNRLRPGLEQAGVKCRDWPPEATGAPDTLILVGPGISPEAQAGDVERLLRTVAAGGTVVWVSPGAGRIPMPAGGDGKPLLPSRLWLQSVTVMAELDKRLGTAWSGALPTELAPVEFPAALCDVRARPAAADSAAPALVWLEARWPGGGRLILCTLPLAEAWNAGPAARYLLAAMLQPAPATPR